MKRVNCFQLILAGVTILLAANWLNSAELRNDPQQLQTTELSSSNLESENQGSNTPLNTSPLDIQKASVHQNTLEEQIEKVISPDQSEIIVGDNETFGTDVMVSDRNKPSGHPAVAYNGSNIYAACEGVYSSYPCIDVYRSTNYGLSWTYVTGWYYSSSTVRAYFPSIAVTSSYVTVTFDKRVSSALDTIRCARIPTGGTTASFYYVDYPRRGTTDIMAAATGSNVYCVYRYTYGTSDWDIEFKSSADGGATWSSRVTVAGSWPITSPFEMPKICAPASNIFVVAFHHWYAAGNCYLLDYSKSTNSGSTWGSTQTFTRAGLVNPDVCGYLSTYLITCTNLGGSDQVAYAYTQDAGSNWYITGGPTYSYYPTCAYGNSRYHVAYTRYSRVYIMARLSPDQLDAGAGITDGTTAQADAIGLITPSARWVCLWKDSRNSTSIYFDGGWTGVEEELGQEIVNTSSPLKIFPNPFSSSTLVSLSTSTGRNAKVAIYNVAGSLVKSLELATNRPSVWDGRGEDGRKLPSGVYFLRATAGDFTATEKVVITR